jgi:hypothetical protein
MIVIRQLMIAMAPSLGLARWDLLRPLSYFRTIGKSLAGTSCFVEILSNRAGTLLIFDTAHERNKRFLSVAPKETCEGELQFRARHKI